MRTTPFLALLAVSSSLVHHIQYTADAIPANGEYWKQLMPSHQSINIDQFGTVARIKRRSPYILKRHSLQGRAAPANADPKAPDNNNNNNNKAPDNNNKAPDNNTKAPDNNNTKAPDNNTKAPDNNTKAPDNNNKPPDNNNNKPPTTTKSQKDQTTTALKDSTQTNPPSGSVTAASNASVGNSGATPAVPTGSMSPAAIAGLSVVGGVVIVVGAIFGFMRKKKNQEQTSAIVAKSATAFEQQSSAYEKIDETLPPVGTFTAISTHTPHLDDELEIQPGDMVTVLVTYDDGWVQGINESRDGAKGVFPRHCVDMDNNSSGFNEKMGKRSSSINGGYQTVNLH